MHGLSGIGKDQADTAAAKFVEEMCAKRSRVAIFSSDFKRARETASAFEVTLLNAANNGHGVGELFSGNVVLDQRLRERFFGEFDGGPDSNYEKVWVEDAKDANHRCYGVESVASVIQRTSALILSIEETLPNTFVSKTLASTSPSVYSIDATAGVGPPACEGWHVVLVAHGDVLQIMQTAFARRDCREHRQLEHLDTATLRRLVLAEVMQKQTTTDNAHTQSGAGVDINEVYGEYLTYYNHQKDKGWKS